MTYFPIHFFKGVLVNNNMKKVIAKDVNAKTKRNNT